MADDRDNRHHLGRVTFMNDDSLQVPTRAGRKGDSQAMPTPNHHVDIQTLVIQELEARRELGIERYGTALQPFNGRDALQDLYEELMDGMVYIRQELEERDLRDGAFKSLLHAADTFRMAWHASGEDGDGPVSRAAAADLFAVMDELNKLLDR